MDIFAEGQDGRETDQSEIAFVPKMGVLGLLKIIQLLAPVLITLVGALPSSWLSWLTLGSDIRVWGIRTTLFVVAPIGNTVDHVNFCVRFAIKDLVENQRNYNLKNQLIKLSDSNLATQRWVTNKSTRRCQPLMTSTPKRKKKSRSITASLASNLSTTLERSPTFSKVSRKSL